MSPPRLLMVVMVVAGTAMLAQSGCDKSGTAKPAPAPVTASARVIKPDPTSVTAAAPDTMPRGRVPGAPPVPVEFQPPQMDFGVVPPGAVAKGRARIFNTGSRTLNIEKSITSCGCTSAESLAGRQIPAGGFIEFGVSLEVKPGLGEKREKVTVFFKEFPGQQVILFFTAEVSRAVRVSPPHLTAVDPRTGGPILAGQVTVTSLDGQPFRVLAAHGAAPAFAGYDPSQPPRNSYTLQWDISREHQAGTVPWYWVLETDHPDAPLVDVRIRHDSTRPARNQRRAWQPKSQRLLLDHVRAGEPVDSYAKIEFGASATPDPTRVAVRGDTPQFTASLVTAEVDGKFLVLRIRVTPKPGPPELIYGTITVEVSGATTDMRVIGQRVE